MKRLLLLVSSAVVLTGCAMTFPKPVPLPPAHAKATEPVLMDANGTPMERIPFRAGVSTVTVETMAKQAGCVGGQGAGLITPQGPVEMYRMMCDNQQVYTARCEFRQCKGSVSQPVRSYAPMAAPVAAPVAAAPQVAHVVTSPVAAPMVSHTAAPVVANAVQSGPSGVLPNRALPMLKVRWACGDCVVDDKVAASIVAEYEKVAAHKKYTVSDAETVDVAIVSYDHKDKHDTLLTKITFRGITLDGKSDARTGLDSMNKVTLDTAEHIYRIMSRAVVRKNTPAAAN